MKSLKLLAVALMMGASLTSCKKDDDEKPKTRTELLTANNWKVTAETVDPGIPDANGTIITNLYGQYKPCDKDDFLKFSAANKDATSGTLLFDEGVSKCNESDPQNQSSSWVFNSDKSKITIDNSTTFDIVELTGSTLKITQTGTNGGTTYTITTTYGH